MILPHKGGDSDCKLALSVRGCAKSAANSLARPGLDFLARLNRLTATRDDLGMLVQLGVVRLPGRS